MLVRTLKITLQTLIILFASSYITVSATTLKAYVSATKDNAVNVIDLDKGQVINTIPNLSSPDSLIITPDNRFVYVANSNAATLSVIDTSTDKVITNIEVGSEPRGLAITNNGKLVLAASQEGNVLVYIDTSNQSIINKLIIPNAYDVTINNLNTQAFVGSQDPKKYALVIIDIEKKSIMRNIPLKNAPLSLQFGLNDHYLYYTAAGVDALMVVDTANYKTIKLIPTAPSLRSIAFTSDGKLGLAVSQSGILYLFDPKTNEISTRLSIGKGAYGMVVAEDNKTVYLTNEIANTVVVVDLVNKKIVKSISVGKGPRKIVLKEIY